VPDDLLGLTDHDVLPRRVVVRVATLALSHGTRLARAAPAQRGRRGSRTVATS
jgi:hypothetical protein